MGAAELKPAQHRRNFRTLYDPTTKETRTDKQPPRMAIILYKGQLLPAHLRTRPSSPKIGCDEGFPALLLWYALLKSLVITTAARPGAQPHPNSNLVCSQVALHAGLFRLCKSPSRMILYDAVLRNECSVCWRQLTVAQDDGGR